MGWGGGVRILSLSSSGHDRSKQWLFLLNIIFEIKIWEKSPDKNSWLDE